MEHRIAYRRVACSSWKLIPRSASIWRSAWSAMGLTRFSDTCRIRRNPYDSS